MGELNTAPLTLSELAIHKDIQARGIVPINMLAQSDMFMSALPFVECNAGKEHLSSFVTGVPNVTYERLNRGVVSGKTSVGTVRFSTSTLTSGFECDARIEERDGKEALDSYRATVATTHGEQMMKTATAALFYEDESTNPDRITGITKFYNSLSANSGENIIDAGSNANDMFSVYLLRLGGTRGVVGLYPKGTQAGFKIHRAGAPTIITDTVNGGQYPAYFDRFTYALGTAVPDWCQNGRIANISLAAVVANSIDVPTLMNRLHETVNEPAPGVREVWVMPRKARRLLTEQCSNTATAAGAALGYMEMNEWKRVTTFRGIPILTVDPTAFITETRVV